MNRFVAVTDNGWFEYHRREQSEEANFWKPGGSAEFAALQPGAPLLFKLKAPHNAIAGGGFFVEFVRMKLSLAWAVFGRANGASQFHEFQQTISKIRQTPGEPDPVIGCIVLASPFFLPPERWLPAPRDWSPSIVSGKTYDASSPIGRELWDWAQIHLVPEVADPTPIPMAVREEEPRFGESVLLQPRLGQGAFRVRVMSVYGRRCAVTGEKTLPALEAGHIRPYGQEGPHKASNGILLRADLHNLFDEGFVTLTADLRVEVSPKIREEFENGREYYRLHGQKLGVIPVEPRDRPAPHFLRWHQENVYRG